ncbi:MAG: putative rane protein, partial [Myxococcaceae bacterium]|nr:putative rane protein [Myxococcaceae bacterium]
ETLTVLVPGGIGLYIVARALGVYWGRDWPASVIVSAMALALAFGLVELLSRQRGAALLEHEVGKLPASPSEATVDAASPVLSALLRARLEQAPMPNLGESVAPFLTGLLVMLGLLGTLLGLFETVRGASLALTGSTDVDALRRSLTTPIEGLTRSFGCSAAGISASAMLGLAVALVRRREGRVLRAVQRYAAGPLRVLSPVRRQARAVEQLAGQGSALPNASIALEKVGTQLGALSERLIAQQEAALETQKRALSELLSGLRADLSQVAADAGSSLHQRVAPLLQDSLTRMDETVRGQASALAEVARELARELSADACARRAEAGEWLSTMAERSAQAESARSQARQAELATLSALANKTLQEAEGRERTLGAHWDALISKVDAQLAAARNEEAERLGRLDTLSQRVGDELSRLSAELGAQVAERRESERSHDERARMAADQLAVSAGALGAGIERQERALEQLVERLPPLFSEAAELAQRSAADALGKLVDSSQAQLAHGASAMGESLAKLVETTDTRLERVSKLLSDELTDRLSSESAHDERARAALHRLEQSSGLLDTSIARQGAGVEELVERVGGLLAQLTEAAQAKAEATLARLSAQADEQAARFAKLSSALESGRAEHARGLEDQLSSHATLLEERLGKTSALVQEAAASWQASTVEMQAVADLFAKSVDRQREASDAWLESLGEVEGAVERAGKHAARDALADQLASTQEVFARQLQFQRELFEQLRSLRTVAPRNGAAGAGEHDVSV